MYTCTYYMRGTPWKSERCISEYVVQRDCNTYVPAYKHTLTYINNT